MITLIALNWTFYTRGQRDINPIHRYSHNKLLLRKRTPYFTDNNESTGSGLKFKGIPEEYRGEIYLPIQQLKSSINYQFYEIQLENKELVFNWRSDDNIEWMNFIISNNETDFIKNLSGDYDSLQEQNCKWNNSVVCYNKENNITSIQFEINSKTYFISSNIEKQKLIKMINHLEIY